jgi:hypothetical protein
MEDSLLLIKLKDTKIFNEKFKKETIKYFWYILNSQKSILIDILNREKQILIDYLRDLKDKKNISFEQIQYNFQYLIKRKLQVQEQKERKNENIKDILLNIDSI